MKVHGSVVAAAGGLLTAAGAHADVAIYSIAFGSPEGPNWVTLEPGQSTSVFVNLWWSPGPTPGGALGLSDGFFSISGSGSGSGSWTYVSNSASPFFHLPAPWGSSGGCVGLCYPTPSGNSINGVQWGLGFLLSTSHPAPDDPANVWRGTFTAASPGVVNFTFSSVTTVGVFKASASSTIPGIVNYPATWFGAQVTIVPSPGAALLAAGALALIAPRRRQDGGDQPPRGSHA